MDRLVGRSVAHSLIAVSFREDYFMDEWTLSFCRSQLFTLLYRVHMQCVCVQMEPEWCVSHSFQCFHFFGCVVLFVFGSGMETDKFSEEAKMSRSARCSVANIGRSFVLVNTKRIKATSARTRPIKMVLSPRSKWMTFLLCVLCCKIHISRIEDSLPLSLAVSRSDRNNKNNNKIT